MLQCRRRTQSLPRLSDGGQTAVGFVFFDFTMAQNFHDRKPLAHPCLGIKP
jgi:hypothetical protein